MIKSHKDFNEIRPYFDEEINPALRRITSAPAFKYILGFLFPEKSPDDTINQLNNIYSIADFQAHFMYHVVYSIIHKTSDGLTHDGFRNLDPKTPYLFISNHRDIMLDSAILQVLLVDNHFPTSEITFGDNLMSDQLVTDIGKINRMFTVYRGGNKKDFLNNSMLLSSYIRHTIVEQKHSVWIAQRNGRTKDGHDKTEPALLKMLNMSGNKNDFIHNFSSLNIVPMSVSYEYEPCISSKANELYTLLSSKYIKQPNEDLQSIISGITEPKGRINISLGEPVNLFLDEINKIHGSNEKINALASRIDTQIYQKYKLWPNNYIAFDLYENNSKHSEYYTNDEKEIFSTYLNQQLNTLTGDKKVLKKIMLDIYRNPVIKQKSSKSK